MKELIKQNEFGISVLKKDESIVIDSRTIAELFGKPHNNVLKDIKRLLENIDGLENGGEVKFYRSSYTSIQNKKLPLYYLNESAFTLLVMGYTTKNAMQFKLNYIKHFNDMKNQLLHLQECRTECPTLTSAIQRLESENPFIYSNEFNMINKIVLGCSTKEFRELHGIKKGDSIRPYCTDEQLKAIRHLQSYDAVLVDVIKDYNLRKAQLELYYNNVYLKRYLA